MCLSCGCGEPNENHGNADHITQQDLDKAARAADITAKEAADNIRKGVSA